MSKTLAFIESASWCGKTDSKQVDIQHARGAEHSGEVQERQGNPKGGRRFIRLYRVRQFSLISRYLTRGQEEVKGQAV